MEKSGKKSPTLKKMIIEQRIQNKLNLLKKKIQEAMTPSCMKDKNPIAGYNLSAHQKRKRKVSKSIGGVVKTDTQGISAHPLGFLRFKGLSGNYKKELRLWKKHYPIQ